MARRVEHRETSFNDIWRTLPHTEEPEGDKEERQAEVKNIQLPEENLLYFIEKASPVLRPWQREIVRIVRNISQYFYPQKQTKVMNEGCATFVHHYIMNELYNRGQISEGAIMEFLHSHSSVVFQPEFDDPRYSGINPYALGFAMMEDIKRICEDPKDGAANGSRRSAGSKRLAQRLERRVGELPRREGFILQYLSPTVMRNCMFAIGDTAEDPHVEIEAIHDERGLPQVHERSPHVRSRHARAEYSGRGRRSRGRPHLKLHHTVHRGRKLSEENEEAVLGHIEALLGPRSAACRGRRVIGIRF
ncbi:MAG: SpoVR family protein [Parvularculaceae bacterium]